MTVGVIIQCRLASTRLPQKALLPLGGKSAILWTLDAMRRVPAETYVLACDFDSEATLRPLAEQAGWECFAGPKDDVLERFCRAAARRRIDLIVRATGDNPFLFYEAAAASVAEAQKTGADYFTFTGLPHGSGVEVLKTAALRDANAHTADPYEREHVGPALYRHTGAYSCVFTEAPVEWRRPDLRTTIDTPADYRRAQRALRLLAGNTPEGKDAGGPFSAAQICAAFTNPAVTRPVFCVPSVQKGRGTGHLRRVLALAQETGADVYVPGECGLAETAALVAQAIAGGLAPWQITDSLPQKGEYALILADAFALTQAESHTFSALAPLAAIDEGSEHTAYCDYVLDSIPAYKLTRKANAVHSEFIPLPMNRRRSGDRACDTVLAVFGGEDPAGLTLRAASACAECGKTVTAITAHPVEKQRKIPARLAGKITFIEPVQNLRESLYLYDAVITHYGFTAFEAVAAGCAVILLGTTPLHTALAKKYGFAYVPQGSLAPARLPRALAKRFGKPETLYRVLGFMAPGSRTEAAGHTGAGSLSGFVRRLAQGERLPCPLCGKAHPENGDRIIARTEERTFRRCGTCGIVYIAWTNAKPAAAYNESYFFAEYKNQYGKTYLEDFAAIKAQGARRCKIINSLYRRRPGPNQTPPALLDVGCAYGPFLSAARDAGWSVHGLDISKEAVDYVAQTLAFPAVCGNFAELEPENLFAQFEKIQGNRKGGGTVRYWDTSTEKATELREEYFGTPEELREKARPERQARNKEEADSILKEIAKNGLLHNAANPALVVTLSNTSIRKILDDKAVKKSFSEGAHFLGAANIDKLFLNAIEPWQFRLDPRKENRDIQSRKFLYSPLLFEEKIVPVKLTVKQYKTEANGIRLYSIEAIDIDLGKKREDVGNLASYPFAETNAQERPSYTSSWEDTSVSSISKISQGFDSVNMWFVIEHFQALGKALDRASAALKAGGIFAFSTPSASGVSAQYNRDAFFAQSPRDHYTLWEPERARRILRQKGFTVVRMVSTGHHPERFPVYTKLIRYPRLAKLCKALLGQYSRLFRLGDTFEVYCVKTGGK
ncbi:MAG: methyltransferase domain-containing protein [Treponema sp.]|jgi:spore coat polysaccharide biosynthesis protein SpsF (cytidylyltransferase family)/2-polyprenyl-3-methyl-5-hydroxy-6-metoxy-1,4-benzoquinol methylase|nr:methyltransferase domain-containing protein [Treponema sp.]